MTDPKFLLVIADESPLAYALIDVGLLKELVCRVRSDSVGLPNAVTSFDAGPPLVRRLLAAELGPQRFVKLSQRKVDCWPLSARAARPCELAAAATVLSDLTKPSLARDPDRLYVLARCVEFHAMEADTVRLTLDCDGSVDI